MNENRGRNFLSLGMGIGSVALMLDMFDDDIDFEAVWVDHGCDWPETIAYADYLREQGVIFTTLIPNVRGWSNLYDYCMDHKIVPLKQFRWCTKDFKISTMNRYFGKPCDVFLGITSDEKHRAKHDVYQGRNYHYPLVDKGIDRLGAIKIIKKHGLEVPPRSNCWFCPFQTKKEILRLYLTHPELYQKMKELEKNSCRPGYWLYEKPLTAFIPENCNNIETFVESPGT